MTGASLQPLVRRPRVFLGPINIAGMMWEYAEGLRAIGCEARVGVLSSNFQQFPADFTLSGAAAGHPLKASLHGLGWLARLAGRYDVFHFDYGMSLLPRHLDLPVLRAMGKRVIVQFLGSDIRCLRYEQNGDYDDDSLHCISCRGGECRGSERERNVRRLARLADAIISTPDASYDDLLPPQRTIVDSFVALDLELWAPDPAWRPADIPLIVHAPSNAAVKGTTFVLEAVERLRAEGFEFEFRLLEGMSNEQVHRVLRGSDIVVDQLLAATNGRLAVEAMALGKPVLGSLSDEYLQMFPDLPIVRTSPANLAVDLADLLRDPGRRLDVGRRGRRFAERLYDRRHVAQRLLRIYSATPEELPAIRSWLDDGSDATAWSDAPGQPGSTHVD